MFTDGILRIFYKTEVMCDLSSRSDQILHFKKCEDKLYFRNKLSRVSQERKIVSEDLMIQMKASTVK